jgi:Membrane bound beta barrel domain (DUF5777)
MKSYIKSSFVTLALVIVSATYILAQQKAPATSSADSLMNAMNTVDKTSGPIMIAKSTRYVLSQTTETIKQGNLNFQVIHRFGDIAGANGGFQTDFGIDRVNDVYIGFEYGITNNLQVDFGRSTIGELLQWELKYALLHQTVDDSSPLAITALGQYAVRPYQSFPTFDSRVSYLGQFIFARKFSNDFNFQVSPTYVINNTPYPNMAGDEKSFFAVQAAARVAINRHMGFILDYAHPFSSYRSNNANFQDPVGLGYEVETGGHVFTLNLTNANAVNEINYLSNTQNHISKGQYRMGFTISRMFDLRPKPKDLDKK